MDSIKKLLTLSSSGINGNNRIKELCGFLDDVFALLDLSTSYQTHLFGPFIYHKLKTLQDNRGIPDEILVTFKQEYYQTAVSNLEKLCEATKVFQAFQQANVLAVPLKGMALIETVYQDLAMRPMADIDMLVKSEDIYKIKKILDDMDYQFINAYRGSYNFEDKRNKVALDLHTKFTRHEILFNIDYKEIYRLLQQINFNSKIQVQVLCLEHQLIHIALHLAPGLYSQFNIINLLDLYHLLSDQQHPLDWEYVVDFSKRSKTASYIYAPIFLCAHLFHEKVPQSVLQVLEGKLSPRKIKYIQNNYLTRILNGNGTNSETFLERLMWAEGLSLKLQLLRMALFPDRQEMAHRYNASENSSKLYGLYLIRLWKLLREIF